MSIPAAEPASAPLVSEPQRTSVLASDQAEGAPTRNLWRRFYEQVFLFVDEQTGTQVTKQVWMIRFVDYVMMVAAAGSADVVFDWFTAFLYIDGHMYVFAAMSFAIIIISPCAVHFYLRKNRVVDASLWEHISTVAVWKESFKAMKTGEKTFGLVFVALGEACLEAFPTSLIQQFSIESGIGKMDGKVFGVFPKFYVIRASMLLSLYQMAKTLYNFDFYGLKQVPMRDKMIRACFRFGEVGTRSMSLSFFWVLLRSRNQSESGFSSWHLPTLMVFSLLANLALIKFHLPKLKWDQMPLWACLFLLGSPPLFLTQFSSLRKSFLVYRLFEFIAIVGLILWLGDDPIERSREKPFFEILFCCCFALMIVTLVLQIASGAMDQSRRELTARTDDGYTALQQGGGSLEEGSLGMIENKAGMGPLSLAVHSDDVGMVKLIGPLIDPNEQDGNGYIPLNYAKTPEMVNRLVKFGTIMVDRETQESLPLPSRALGQALLNDQDELRDALLAKGVKADKHCIDIAHGKLHGAIQNDDLKRVQVFAQFAEGEVNMPCPDKSYLAENVVSKPVWEELKRLNAKVQTIRVNTIKNAPVDVIKDMIAMGADADPRDPEVQHLLVEKLLLALEKEDVDETKVYAELIADDFDDLTEEESQKFTLLNYTFLARAKEETTLIGYLEQKFLEPVGVVGLDGGRSSDEEGYDMSHTGRSTRWYAAKSATTFEAGLPCFQQVGGAKMDKLLPWGAYVYASAENDDWVKITSKDPLYLPKKLNNNIVLRPVVQWQIKESDNPIESLVCKRQKDHEPILGRIGIGHVAVGDDIRSDETLVFGQIVDGVDEGDGWVRVQLPKDVLSLVAKKIANIVPAMNMVKSIFKGELLTNISDIDTLVTLANHGIDVSEDPFRGASIYECLAARQAAIGIYGYFETITSSGSQEDGIATEGASPVIQRKKVPLKLDLERLVRGSSARSVQQPGEAAVGPGFFTNDHLTELIESVDHHAQIVKFNIMGEDCLTDIGFENFKFFLHSRLQQLSVHIKNGKCLSDKALEHLMENMPRLKVRFAEGSAESSDKHSIMGLYISIGDNDNITDEGLEKIAEGVSRAIFSLSLPSNTGCTDRGLMALARAMPQTVQELSLNFASNTKFTDLSLKTLAGKMPPAVVALTFNFTTNENFTDDGMKELAEAMKERPELKHLSLNFEKNDNFGNDSLKELSKGMPPTATTLSLNFKESRQKIDDVGLMALTESIPETVIALCLNFGDNQNFRDDSLRKLAERIGKLKKATRISLNFAKNINYGAQKDDQNCTVLVELAKSIPEDLSSIFLDFSDNTNFTSEDFRKLAKSLSKKGIVNLSLSFAKSTNFDDYGLEQLRIPETAKNLSIDFEWNTNFRGKGLMALAATIPASVTSLRLNFAKNFNFDAKSFRRLAEKIPNRAISVMLNFEESTNFTDRGLEKMAANMPPRAKIVHLNLRKNKRITDTGLSALARKMPRGATDIDLDFQMNEHFTDEALEELGKNLPFLARSISLNFAFTTNFKNEGLEAFAERIPATVTKLKLILAYSKHISDDGLTALARKLPPRITHLNLNFQYNDEIGTDALVQLIEKIARRSKKYTDDFCRGLAQNRREMQSTIKEDQELARVDEEEEEHEDAFADDGATRQTSGTEDDTARHSVSSHSMDVGKYEASEWAKGAISIILNFEYNTKANDEFLHVLTEKTPLSVKELMLDFHHCKKFTRSGLAKTVELKKRLNPHYKMRVFAGDVTREGNIEQALGGMMGHGKSTKSVMQ